MTLENELVAVTILPEKGADIYSFIFKAKAMDVLWKSPWTLASLHQNRVFTGGNTETAWMDQYEGGWQEIFPNGSDECVYRNASLGFHGEASISAWDYQFVSQEQSRIEIELTVRLRRTPFELRRRMIIESGLAGFRMAERIVNQGDEDLAFMWGHHPAVGGPFLASGLKLKVPARTFLNHDVELSSQSRIPAGVKASWPLVKGTSGEPIDLSIMPKDGVRFAEFGYISDLDDGWYGLTSDVLGFGFGMAWSKEVFPHLWLWQERHGSKGYPWYGRCSVMAVEPFSSIMGPGLLGAIEAGTAPVLKAGMEVETEVAAVFYETSEGELQSIRPDGTVRFSN